MAIALTLEAIGFIACLLEFVDEPVLPIRWLAAWKLRKLENHLTALQEEAAVSRT